MTTPCTLGKELLERIGSCTLDRTERKQKRCNTDTAAGRLYTCSMDQMSKHTSKENRREVTDLFYNRSHLRKTTQNLEILKRESKNQVTSGGQRTYLRGQNYGKVQAARTKEAEAIPGTALARARVLQKKKTPAGKGGVGSDKQEGKPSEEATKKKRRKPRDTTLGNHRRWYRSQTPEKHRSIERVL